MSPGLQPCLKLGQECTARRRQSTWQRDTCPPGMPHHQGLGARSFLPPPLQDEGHEAPGLEGRNARQCIQLFVTRRVSPAGPASWGVWLTEHVLASRTPGLRGTRVSVCVRAWLCMHACICMCVRVCMCLYA